LNKYLFQMANIREHCSWVHMKEPKKATQKAKDIVRMAVAKAWFLKPQEETEVKVTPTS
jgi:heterodisulfide reductase subunit A